MKLTEQQLQEALQYLEESNKLVKLYHLSEKEITEKMIPRVPKSDYEDQKTPRICFSTSIEGCLIGINENKNIIGKVYHVYSITTSDYYKPTKKEVADVKITDEVWYKKPIMPNYEYDIKVTNKKSEQEGLINGNKFKVPVWDYEVIK